MRRVFRWPNGPNSGPRTRLSGVLVAVSQTVAQGYPLDWLCLVHRSLGGSSPRKTSEHYAPPRSCSCALIAASSPRNVRQRPTRPEAFRCQLLATNPRRRFWLSVSTYGRVQWAGVAAKQSHSYVAITVMEVPRAARESGGHHDNLQATRANSSRQFDRAR